MLPFIQHLYPPLALVLTGIIVIMAPACDVSSSRATPPPTAPTATTSPEPTEAVSGPAAPDHASDQKAYATFLENLLLNLRGLMPEVRELLDKPQIDDGFWGLRLTEAAGGLKGMFDQLVAKTPPDDRARYHLMLVAALGSTAESVDRTATAWSDFDFQTFTPALKTGRQSLDQLEVIVHKYGPIAPGTPPASRG